MDREHLMCSTVPKMVRILLKIYFNFFFFLGGGGFVGYFVFLLLVFRIFFKQVEVLY
jgi:hypothetical protein